MVRVAPAGLRAGPGRVKARRHFSACAAARGPACGSPGPGGPGWSRHLPGVQPGQRPPLWPLAPDHLRGPVTTTTHYSDHLLSPVATIYQPSPTGGRSLWDHLGESPVWRRRPPGAAVGGAGDHHGGAGKLNAHRQRPGDRRAPSEPLRPRPWVRGPGSGPDAAPAGSGSSSACSGCRWTGLFRSRRRHTPDRPHRSWRHAGRRLD